MYKEELRRKFWKEFSQLNRGYVEEQYEQYLKEPEAADLKIQQLFANWGKPVWLEEQAVTIAAQEGAGSEGVIKNLAAAIELIEAIRRYGHLEADIYPVGNRHIHAEGADPAAYGLTEADLRRMPVSWLRDKYPADVANGAELIRYLKTCYTGKISFEYDHVNSDKERKWLQEHIEAKRLKLELAVEDEKKLLERLAEVEGFETFLQKTFVGQKRFSIEGLETMILMLDQIARQAAADNIGNIMVGMAHRGRLSVLAHVLGKPVDKIFSEFHKAPNRELLPSEGSAGINYGWSGDVKYHFGAKKQVVAGSRSTRITLAHNPSHLEFVNPVVQGYTRAAQDVRTRAGIPRQRMDHAFSVLIHGDAAFIGEGVVAETLNLSGLAGYRTGGTVHIIANNRIGYTTTEKEGRSTRYASDLAKGFEIPIIHVNADDPHACLTAAILACKYRKTFEKDILIDLVGYRRYGHNEMDEPRSTQPILYAQIDEHPSVAALFEQDLIDKGLAAEGTLTALKREREALLRQVYGSMEENGTEDLEIGPLPKALAKELGQFDTGVPLDKLKALNKALLRRPEGFKAFPKVERILRKRELSLEEGNQVDWGCAEALAYASILSDGVPIRLTGQDSERGTFAHRHMVLHDLETEATYCVMHGLEQNEASFDIYNSPLSEAGVLGFEYGYSVQAPETLVIWEAQFGDFANAAQVIFDQFIVSSRAKWGEKSGLVMLLPHGYEGQGPEHSSARPERFLQLAAENNLICANVSSSVQFFHLIRRQAALCGKEAVRPLIVLTPKSLLRNPAVASDPKEFADGCFKPILCQSSGKGDDLEAVQRILIGSGKIMIELEQALNSSLEDHAWLEVLRLEQFYPFPEKTLRTLLDRYPNADDLVWVQEEPRNMGAWDFVDDYLRELLRPGQKLRYIGRPKRSSPAVGEPNLHRNGQNHIIQAAISPDKRSVFL